MRRFLLVAATILLACSAANSQELKDIERAYLEVVEKVKPASVHIQVVQERKVKDVHGDTDTIISMASFSGTVVSDQGHVATIARGVKDTKKIYVETYKGMRYEAELVGIDDRANLGIIKVKSFDRWEAKPIEFGDSHDLKVGQFTIIMGSPCGLKHSVVYGNVSGVNRTLLSENTFYTGMIQLSSPLSHSDPGGLVADSEGKLIGMVSPAFLKTPAFRKLEELIENLNRQIAELIEQVERLKHPTAPGERKPEKPKEKTRERMKPIRATDLYDPALSQGINFAIPGYVVKEVCDRIIHGKKRPYLGVSVRELFDAEKKQFDLEYGLNILQVVTDSPAEKGGLKMRDIILSAGDRKIESVQTFRDVITNSSVGEELKLTVFRKKEKIEIAVKLGERP